VDGKTLRRSHDKKNGRSAIHHMRQLKRCFSYVTESLGLAVRDQAIDPIG
jgi:hypothetical protein